MQNRKKYIVIGNSAAGIAALRTLRLLDKQADIICFSDEQEQPYNKCLLADYLSGAKSEGAVYTLTQEQLTALSIDMRLATKIVSIEPKTREVIAANGHKESYDLLLLATGARSLQLALATKIAYHNLFSFHSLNQAQTLYTYIKQQQPQSAIVIGAGLSGVEAADALVKQGIQVTIIERSEQVLTGHINKQASDFLCTMIKRSGAHVLSATSVQSFKADNDIISHVVLADGTAIAADIVIMTAGVVRNYELAHAAHLMCDAHGIVVNEYLQSSDPAIYAAGDIIGVTDIITKKRMTSCTWPDAMQQGRYAAYAMAGKPQAYEGALIVTSSAFFGITLHSAGIKSSEQYIEEQSDLSYRCLLYSDGKLKGFVLLGDGKEFVQLKRQLLKE